MGLCVLLTVLAWAAPVRAANELGRVQFSGKSIILFDDNSWTYVEQTSVTPSNGSDCTGGVIASDVLPNRMCMNGAVWGEQPHGAGLEQFFVLKGADLYMALITERTPINEDAIRGAIITNAANGAGVTKDQVKIYKEETLDINNAQWHYIEYGVTLSGTMFHYANFYRKFPDKGSAQVLFFSSDNQFEGLRVNIDKLVMTTTITP
jgi:hypothetical protein